jgi:hypothetical protein
MFQHQPQGFGEAEDGVCRFAPRVGQIRDGKKRPINVVMTVYQEQPHPNIIPLMAKI